MFETIIANVAAALIGRLICAGMRKGWALTRLARRRVVIAASRCESETR